MATDLEMRAAALEADQANRDMMMEWLGQGHLYFSEHIQDLRRYRSAAERVLDAMINAQVEAISAANEYSDQSTWFVIEFRTQGGDWNEVGDYDTREQAEDYLPVWEGDWPGYVFRIRRVKGLA